MAAIRIYVPAPTPLKLALASAYLMEFYLWRYSILEAPRDSRQEIDAVVG
jgi:hypothetical protein